METRGIGSLAVSLVGLGCNNFGMRIDEDQSREVVKAALDAGITLFDTADIYGGTRSEEFLGRALKGVRDEVFIATKFGAPVGDGMAGAKPEYVTSACDASLRRLGTDHIDLYQLHMPDDTTPIADTLGALDTLVKAGKVREIGCSNFDGERMDAADSAASAREMTHFASVQNQLNLLDRRGERDLLDGAARHNLGILPYFPLASGMLTGKYRRDAPPPEGTRLAAVPEERRQRAMSDKSFDVVERLESFAAERDRTLLELAMSWLSGLPGMASVIAGATRPAQVHDNASAVGWELTDDDRAHIDELTQW
jgi:aryl-alcohol dehydrogenase-like predicted oxidoreductase